MSEEFAHDYAHENITVRIFTRDLAELRQRLYDAKLYLAAKDTTRALVELTTALDITQDWTLK